MNGQATYTLFKKGTIRTGETDNQETKRKSRLNKATVEGERQVITATVQA